MSDGAGEVLAVVEGMEDFADRRSSFGAAGNRLRSNLCRTPWLSSGYLYEAAAVLLYRDWSRRRACGGSAPCTSAGRAEGLAGCRRLGAGDGGYAAQVVVRAAETSPAPIAGIAPSYG